MCGLADAGKRLRAIRKINHDPNPTKTGFSSAKRINNDPKGMTANPLWSAEEMIPSPPI